MHRIKIRIVLFLGVLALAATASGPAQAQAVGGAHKTPKARVAKAAVRSASTKAGSGAKATAVTGTSVAAVTAGSTGDGPADDDECDRWAGAINEGMSELREDNATNSGDVREDIDNINHLTDGAMDRGCFIVY
jgi:hypothetical protein